MLKRIVESLTAVLDWCWPLPLGIFFGGLVLSVSVGSWLVFREPEARLRPPLRTETHSGADSPAFPQVPPPPLESAAPAQTGPSVAADEAPFRSGRLDTPPASIPSQSQRASRIPAPGPRTPSAENPSAREGESRGKAPLAHRHLETLSVPSESKVPVTASRLSPAQEAELRDKLTLGRFFMDRKDYRAAIAEFQAALAVDPSNREAQAAIQQARDANKDLESSPQP